MTNRKSRSKKRNFKPQIKKKKIKNEFPLVQGSLSVHPRGFGFVKIDDGPDVFIPKHRILNAVDGDEVEVEITSTLSPKGPEGSVVAILKRSRNHLAGIVIGLLGSGKYQAFAPLLGKEKSLRVETKEKLILGDRVICKIEDWDDKKGGVRGTLVRKLGNISDPSIDIEAAIAEFELPDGFSKEALAEALAFGGKVSKEEFRERLDLTEDECVTIDPDTARDYDDAISLTQDDRGHFHLGVHIADVAHYVKAGSHLDKEAFERCNSTYFPGQCVPMLPEALSNELCSLKPNVPRLAESVLAEFASDGTLISYKIVKTVIKSKKRFTYKEALAVLEKKKNSPHAALLERMVALCHLLKKKRFERGSIDFSMVENRVMVDEKGTPLGIEKIEYDITHQMIEEFMLKANEIVAIYLSQKGKQLIYRVHESPTDESFKDFYSFARSLGFTLPAAPTHMDIQKLFQEAKNSPLLSQLSVSFIRSMRLAAYSSDNIGHYGLALEYYCHFTSPIRRYTDLIIQRLLFDELPESCDVNTVATKCSEKERVSFRAESSVVILKKLRLAGSYFENEPKRIYSAVVTRVKPFALFFEVPFFDLEGSLHVSKLGNDYFEFDAEKMKFKGAHTGKSFSIGQEIFVRLEKIEYILHETEWALSQPPAAKVSKKR